MPCTSLTILQHFDDCYSDILRIMYRHILITMLENILEEKTTLKIMNNILFLSLSTLQYCIPTFQGMLFNLTYTRNHTRTIFSSIVMSVLCFCKKFSVSLLLLLEHIYFLLLFIHKHSTKTIIIVVFAAKEGPQQQVVVELSWALEKKIFEFAHYYLVHDTNGKHNFYFTMRTLCAACCIKAQSRHILSLLLHHEIQQPVYRICHAEMFSFRTHNSSSHYIGKGKTCNNPQFSIEIDFQIYTTKNPRLKCEYYFCYLSSGRNVKK